MGETFPERRHLMVRGLDVETRAVLRREAERRKWSTAAVLEHIVREWVACRADKTPPAVVA